MANSIKMSIIISEKQHTFLMELSWLIAAGLFTVFAYIFWKLTSDHLKEVYGVKNWQRWTTRLFYWQGAIYTSAGMTFLVMYFLKWVEVL